MRESERSTYIFVSERDAPLSVAGYQRMVARAGAAAGFPLPAALPLFGTGLGVIGWLARRRKRKGADAVAA